MIQRIQSLFLFLAFVCVALLFVFPVADLLYPEGRYTLYIMGLYKSQPEMADKIFTSIPLIVLAAASAILSIVTVFMFKARPKQIRNNRINLLITATLIILIFFYIDKAVSISPDSSKTYSVGIVFPIIALVFILLANRAIKKDEALVRSADRIR